VKKKELKWKNNRNNKTATGIGTNVISTLPESKGETKG